MLWGSVALLIGGLVSLLFPKPVLEMFEAFEKLLPFGKGFFTSEGEILYRICGGTMVMIALIALAGHFFL
jgi:hypothetical protein